ncbi:MAG: aspartate aminotransferase family protein [Holosporales bacterium]
MLSSVNSSPILPVYSPFPVAFVRGEGCWLHDADGHVYLDCSSGVAVNALGHNHPALLKALHDQAAQVWHTSNWYQSLGQEKLGQILIKNSFADYVFFGNSGAEALECGIKIVRSFFRSVGQSQRHRIISAKNAFHGRTLAALSACGKGGFEPMLPGFHQVPYGDLNALEAAINNETAAILLEPIQGEGGINMPPLGYFKAVREICNKHNILLFLDEIQTGIGRTGYLFAYEAEGIRPDVLASAKGLGGGFPIGACLTTKEAARGMTTGTHGSTFGGNPLATAVSTAVLDEILQHDFLPHVAATGKFFLQGLHRLVADHPRVFDAARGSGLMLGLVCIPDNRLVAEMLLAEGLLVIPAGGNVIRLLPPLIFNKKEAEEALTRLDRAAIAWEAKKAYA